MARFFLGGGRSSGGNGKKTITRTGFDKKTGKQVTLSAEEQYKKLFEQKMAAYQKDYSAGAKSHNFQLPGTKPAEQKKSMSKGAQAILEKIAAVKVKREMKKKQDAVKITPKHFGGMHPGRLDANGNIYNSANQVIAKVDPKTGKIKNKNGNVIGKYKPEDTYCEYRISRIIMNASLAATARQNNLAGWNPMTGGVNKPADNSPGGSVYGNPGNFWGGNNDDDNKGWW